MTNPYEIEAKPTKFKGFTYRSILEAKAACFFDWLGLDFFYEPELFEYDGIIYLPDFKLFMPDGSIRWIEMKGPELYEKADTKAKMLAWYTGKLVQIWQGSWGNQTIYSYVMSEVIHYNQVIRISHQKLDTGWSYYDKSTIKEAYEKAEVLQSRAHETGSGC